MCLVNQVLVKKEEAQQYTNKISRPRLSKISRKIVKSAKVNLNRYWNKLEEIFSNESDRLQRLNNENYEVLNNHASHDEKIPEIEREEHPDSWIIPDPVVLANEINEFLSKSYEVERAAITNGRYKHFQNDFLYHGVNLNLDSGFYDNCPCTCHAPSIPQQQQQQQNSMRNGINSAGYLNRFSVCVMQNLNCFDVTQNTCLYTDF